MRAPTFRSLVVGVLAIGAAAACGGSSDTDLDAPGDGSDGGADATTDATSGTKDAAADTSAIDASAPQDDAAPPIEAGGGNGGPDASPAPDAALPPPTAGQDATVAGFDKKLIDYAGSSANRTAEVTAAFPASGSYAKITLHLTLACPQGGCDAWDRFATLGVVQSGPSGDVVLEIARFMTPYGIGASWDIDVTQLRPILRGNVKLRAFIDTWVPQTGANSGNGWLLTTTFDMKGGVGAHDPIAVLPIWQRTYAVYGEPTKPITTSVPPQTIDLAPLRSAGATTFAVRSFVTGHGQGGADNCAEFCPRTHTITVASKAHPLSVWRTDCATTAVPGQHGTFTYSRAGWCPGATVRDWTIDATADLASASSASFAYDVQSWTNGCRPTAITDAGTCPSCNGGAPACAYDGAGHTEPYYYVSSLLIASR